MSSNLYNLIIGTLLGAVVSSIAFFYKRRQDRKKKLNQVLYILLEMWGTVKLISQINSEKFTVNYQKYVAKNYHESIFSEEGKSTINHTINGFAKNILKENKNLSEKDLLAIYRDSIQEVSQYYPALAYRMSKDRQLKERLNFVDEYFKEINNSDSALPNQLKTYFKEKIIKDILSSLEKDISKLALKSGLLTWIKIKLLIAKKKKGNILDVEIFERTHKDFYMIDSSGSTFSKPQL